MKRLIGLDNTEDYSKVISLLTKENINYTLDTKFYIHFPTVAMTIIALGFLATLLGIFF